MSERRPREPREPDVESPRPRFLARSLDPRQRRVYLAAAVWFALVAFGSTWPGFLPFNRIRPLVLGMPLSLFYLGALAVLSFGVGVALLLWELRQGLIDEPSEPGD